MRLDCVICGKQFETQALDEFCPECSSKGSSVRTPPSSAARPRTPRPRKPSTHRRKSAVPIGMPDRDDRKKKGSGLLIGGLLVGVAVLGLGAFLLMGGSGPTGGGGGGGGTTPEDADPAIEDALKLHKAAAARGIYNIRAMDAARRAGDSDGAKFVRGVLTLEETLLPYGPFETLLHARMTRIHRITTEPLKFSAPPKFAAYFATPADKARADLSVDPKGVPEGLVARGRALLALAEGKYDEARGHLDGQSGKDYDARPILAWIDMADGKLQDAERKLEGGATAPVIGLLRAQLAILRDRPSIAAMEADLVLGKDDLHAPARHLRALARVLQNRNEDISGLLRNEPDSLVLLHASAARAAKKRDWKTFEKAQTKIIDRAGHNFSYVYFPRALARFRQGNFEGAWTDTDKARDALKTDPAFFYFRASLLDGRGEYDQAVGELDAGLKIASEAERLLLMNLSADINYTLEEYDQAYKDLKEVVSLSPKKEQYLRLARAHLWNEDWAGVEEAAKEMTKLFPRDGQAHGMLGLAYFRQEKWPEAEKAFTEAIKYDDTITNRNNRSIVRHRMGGRDNIEASLVDLSRVIGDQINIRQALDRAHLNMHLERTDRADEDLTRLKNTVKQAEQAGQRFPAWALGEMEALQAWMTADDADTASKHILQAAKYGIDVMEWVDDDAIKAKWKDLEVFNQTKKLLDDAKKQAKEALKKSAFLGVQMNQSSAGVTVVYTMKDTAARRGGVRTGDRIVRVNESTIREINDIRRLFGSLKPGDEIRLDLLRDPGGPMERALKRTIILGSRPEGS